MFIKCFDNAVIITLKQFNIIDDNIYEKQALLYCIYEIYILKQRILKFYNCIKDSGYHEILYKLNKYLNVY